jgi:hypothetical protein
VALAIRAVKPAGKITASVEEAAKKRSITASDLGGALAQRGDSDTNTRVTSVIEIGDI